MARNLSTRLRMVIDPPKMISIRHGREGAIEREDFQAMPRQIEFANDFGAEQGNDIRTNRKLESGKDFFRDGGAAQKVPAIEHEHAFARARQIRGIDQTVVAAADDD